MSADAQIVIYGIVGVFLLVVMQSLYRRRHAVAYKLRGAFIVVSSYLLAMIIAAKFTHDPVKILLIGVLVGVLVGDRVRRNDRPRRHISRHTRRKVIARFERSGGRYDPKKYEIDHIVPWSRGGTNTADNLRVIPRDANREKSDRSPWWDVFGR